MRSVRANCQRPRDSDNHVVLTGTPWCGGVSRIVGVVLASLQKKDETANSTHLAILLKLSKTIIEKVTLHNIKL